MRNQIRVLQDSRSKSSSEVLVHLKFIESLFILIVIAFVSLSIALAAVAVGSSNTTQRILLESNQSAPISNNTIVSMPSFNFTLSGHVLTHSGAPAPNGTVRINAFDSVLYAKTDLNGAFETTLTVPPDAADGLYQITIAFEANGLFGPSSNFTLVDVVRKALNYTLNVPAVIIPGTSATITGNIKSNGSALAGCAVSVALPWGVYYGTTDTLGNYKVSVSVPLTQFSPTVQATISTTPEESYVERTQTTRSIGVFNPAEFTVLVIIIGAVIYEVRNLELVSKKRTTSSSDLNPLDSLYKKRDSETESKLSKEGRSSRIISIYLEALSIAIRKFQIRFVESLTIRQTIDEISKRDKEGEGSAIFSQIAMIMEDFAYSSKFDESRVKDADQLLEELKTTWARGDDAN